MRASTGTRLRLAEDPVVVKGFAELLERTGDCIAIGVDIPIGLSDNGPRQADIEARKLLGARRASVFPAPVRATLRGGSHREASIQSMLASGKGMSIQAYHILPKVRDADAAMTAKLQQRVVEVHPEVSFWAMNGGKPLALAKKSAAGREERLALLARRITGIASLPPPAGAARDDLLDACAAAWSAARVATGKARRLPSQPVLDPRGLRMEIVY